MAKSKESTFAELVGAAFRQIEDDRKVMRPYRAHSSLSLSQQSALDKFLNAAAAHALNYSANRTAQKFKSFRFDGAACDLECVADGDAFVVWALSPRSGDRLIGLYQRNVSTF